MVLCFLDTIRDSTRTSLSDNFLLHRQLLLLDVVRPSLWYADITMDTMALDTPQRLAVLVTDAPARCAPTICPLLNSDMSPIMLCVLQCFMYSCAIALLIQPSHSSLTGAVSEDWLPGYANIAMKSPTLLYIGQCFSFIVQHMYIYCIWPIYIYIYIYIYIKTHTHIYTHTYIYIYIPCIRISLYTPV